MKIALIGPGILPIPPPGWGAVEILIWDYAVLLREKGHQVDILNEIRRSSADQSAPYTPYCQRLIYKINTGDYDFVHLHYDCLFHIMMYLTCPKKAITSHYPYIDQLEKHHGDGYSTTFEGICQNEHFIIFTVSQKDYDVFHKYSQKKENIRVLLGGIPTRYSIKNDNPQYPNKSVYLGKIEPRKAQKKYISIPNIDFYGPCYDSEFCKLECYKGELSRDKLYQTLSEYGNMILLSTGENGTPYVIKEALFVGLPIVTNQYSSNDLDVSLPFIDIIPNNKLEDLTYISDIIQQNLVKQNRKQEIIDYAIRQFSLESICDKYLEVIFKDI
jgi:glycosyltransferase involved in cell wall biosynthesis